MRHGNVIGLGASPRWGNTMAPVGVPGMKSD
jgi:hypothetical protein